MCVGQQQQAHLLLAGHLLLEGKVLVQHVCQVEQQRAKRDRQRTKRGKVQRPQRVVGPCKTAQHAMKQQ